MRLSVNQAAKNLRVSVPTVKRYGEKLNVDWANFNITDQEKIRALLKSSSQCLTYILEGYKKASKSEDKKDAITKYLYGKWAYGSTPSENHKSTSSSSTSSSSKTERPKEKPLDEDEVIYVD